jgi:small subunit ribosomal protein S15e
MASKGGEQIDAQGAGQKKKAFKKSTYRGIELEKLIEYPMDALVKLMKARQRRRFAHGIH